MNIFDLRRNNRTLELVNISTHESRNIRFQVRRIVPDGDKGKTESTEIHINEIESLKPGDLTKLKFDSEIVVVALARLEIDTRNTHQYKTGDSGFCLSVFFDHPLDESQTIYLWTIR